MVPDPLYVERDGERWRVHDTVYANGKNTRVPLEHPRANYRVFVSAAGWRKAWLFKRGESRSVEMAAGQFARAGYILPFPSDYRPVDWRAEAQRRDAETRASRWCARAMAKAAAARRAPGVHACTTARVTLE